MSTRDFLERLSARGIELRVEEEQLRFRAPKGTMTPELLAELKERKAAVLAWLTERSGEPASAELPASAGQQRMWFLSQLLPGSAVYNVHFGLDVEGALDPQKLSAALDDVVVRHWPLRATFRMEGGRLSQHPGAAPSLMIHELRPLGAPERAAELARLARADAVAPFDLGRGPLLRATLVRVDDQRHALLVTVHHIITDGTSVARFVDELISSYAARAGHAAPLPALVGDYADFIRREQRALSGGELTSRLDAYAAKLAGVPALDLPFRRQGVGLSGGRGARVPFSFSRGETDALRALGQRAGCSLFMTVVAGFATLLHRYSGQDDFALGTFGANREQRVYEQLLGLFMNTVVMRCDFGGDPSFLEVLARTRSVILDALDDQAVPFDALVQRVRPSREDGANPMFRAAAVMVPRPRVTAETPGLRWTPIVPTVDMSVEGTSKVDLLLKLSERDGEIDAEIEIDTDRYDVDVARRAAGHLRTLLFAAAEAPERSAAALSLLTPEERRQILEVWNDTARPYRRGVCLHELIREQALRTPSAEAVRFRGDAIDYATLEARSNRLARHLRSLGAGRGALVGVCLRRSISLVVATLAAMKAGAAYVPLEPSYPRERLSYMADNARLSVLVTDAACADLAPRGEAPVVILEEAQATIDALSEDPPASGVTEDDLAYVIYTSGSTGRPKGAANAHVGICNRLLWMQEAFSLGPSDRVLQKTPFGFDVSVWELFWPLMTGARLVIAEPEGHRDPGYLVDVIKREAITVMHFVPSMLMAFLERRDLACCSSLRRVILSGEALSHGLQERFFAAPLSAELHNLYGPTEAAVDVTAWDCSEDRRRDPVPIGRPIANLRIYILDARGEPAPIDVPGRLYIGGIGVGRGYVNQPELTAAAFVADPFAGEPQARMYFTGDLARFCADGTIEFLGRIDHQVKIGGCRIELEEIESALRDQPGVLDSVVVAHRDATRGDRLIAYFVPAAGAAIAESELRAALEAKVPSFMIPSQLIALERMPLSPNGKLDRAALPAPEAAARLRSAARADGARDALERSIAEVLAEVLGVEEIDPAASFFQLGGTSLLVVHAVQLLSERLGLPLTVAEVFNHPTAASLARRARGAGAAPAVQAAPADASEAIAIIGVGCRFPGGANDPASFWALLREGIDAVTEVPGERWDVDALYDPDPDAPGKMNSRWGGFLSRIDQFEPAFFGISPREAVSLDPQHRLLLEVAFEALEDAGRFSPGLAGSDTGVYVGICSFDYQGKAIARRQLDQLDGHAGSGNVDSMASGRLAYWLGVHGPAVSVDTACSSSLVSIHLACQALREGECSMALAGGVNLLLSPTWGVYMTRVRMASPTGRCHAFDASADGYVRAEGCGLIVLKRLSDAQRDGDRILAIIRGSAINQDGRSATLTAPNGVAQEAVLRKALARAGVSPAEIDYVEAHGTGTPLGDPIEVEALSAVLGEGRPADRPVVLGSVKTNFGHAEGAAGVAGVIKTALALDRGEIPPSLHFSKPNPHIPWASLPVTVAARRMPWPDHGGPHLAGVSSFGFSGTNAHVILQQAPARRDEPRGADRPLHVLALSARREEALSSQAARLLVHLGNCPEDDVGDVCHSANVGRLALPHRAAIVAGSRDALRADLAALAAGEPARPGVHGPAEAPARKGGVAFLFTGQGAQYAGMGRALYDAQPVFRAAIDRAAALLDQELLRPLLAVIRGEHGALLDDTAYTQPALFAIEVALAELWQSWGIRPDVVLGHSVGEIAAACVAGVFSLEDGLALIAGRGRLMSALPAGGAMMSLRAGEERVRAALEGLEDRVAIAAVNAADQVVLAGEADAVHAIVAQLAAEGVEARALHVSHAFHSPLMDPMLAPFEQLARARRYAAPSLSLISNVDAALPAGAFADPAYWVRHARAPVRFADGVAAMLEKGVTVAIELGPHPTLTTLGKRASEDVTWLPSLRRDRDDWETLLGSLAALHTLGFDPDWRSFDAPYRRRRVSLPAYPFQRTSHWLGEASAPSGAAPTSGVPQSRRMQARFALSGEALDLPTASIHHVLPLGLSHQPYLADHVLHEEVVVPGAFYLAVAVALASERFGTGMFELHDLLFVSPLILTHDTELHIVLTYEREGRFSLEMSSPFGEGEWRRHLTGTIEVSPRPAVARIVLDHLLAHCPHAHPPSALFGRIAEQGIDLRPGWRWIESIYTGGNDLVARITPPASAEFVGPIHPTLLDNSFGGAYARMLEPRGADVRDPTPRVPFSMKALRVYRPAKGPVFCHGVVRPETLEGSTVSDIVLFDEEGEIVAELDGFTIRRAPRDVIQRARRNDEDDDLHEIGWEPAVALPGADGAGALGGPVLLLADRSSALAGELARQIRDRGARCLIVERGATLEPLGEDRWAVDPIHPTGFQQLLAAEGIGEAMGSVIWQWGTDALAEQNPTGGVWEASQGLLTGALHLVQALLRRSSALPPRVHWLTRGAQWVPGTEQRGTQDAVRALAQAPLLGFARVLASEHPELAGARLDLDPSFDDGDLAALLDAIATSAGGMEAAHRRGQRLTPRLGPLHLAEGTPSSTTGTVLITGGLGGLGITVARWLVTSGTARHIALLGRREPAKNVRIAMEEIRALGASVRSLAADVSDPDSLDRALNALSDGPPLRGVIHAAGVLDDGVLLQQGAARFAAVLLAKVRGAWALHERTLTRPLDFFVLFSSASGLLGAQGQASYAAANVFLDALAHHRHSLGLPALSVDWGPWAEVGMAAELSPRNRERLGLRSLSPSRAVRLLSRALAHQKAQVAAMPLDLSALELERAPVPGLLRHLMAVRPPASQRREGGGKLAAQLAGLPVGERRKLVEEALRAEITRILRLPAGDVAVHRPLQEQGLDSLMAMELRGAVSKLTGASIPATLAFDYPTVEAIARYLLESVLKVEDQEVEPVPSSKIVRAPAATHHDDPVAILGMGCRFPGGATDLERLWTVLDRGTDTVREVPKDRWDVDVLYDPDPDAPGKTSTRYGAFVDGVELFDPGFFGMAPREAQSLDPQQRLLLEVSWEALEHAGIPPARLSGTTTGVFTALITHDYQAMHSVALDKLDGYLVTGTGAAVASGRLSYLLGLKGPSFTVDTACSASLLAIHLACQSLRAGECDMALAGGVTVLLSPLIHVEFSRLRAMSPDGRCKTFDAAADGVGWGDGCGVLVLKRLRDAQRDGDRVLAVIRGSAVNQDGRSNGLTAPNGPAQQAVLRSALAQARLAPADIDYIEAHGTGTPLGDPIEVQAIGAVFGEGRAPDKPVVIGSIKTNFGHTQAAAGVAGVIKTVLALQHERIPKNVHFRTPSPHIPWTELPVCVAADPVPWPAGSRLRRAGVSAFGVSGTNVHVIIEEAPPAPRPPRVEAALDRPAHVVALSGAVEGALRARARQLHDHLAAHPELELADVAYTANARRDHLLHRIAIVAESRQEALASLGAAAAGAKDPRVIPGPEAPSERPPRIAFLFTGQGAQRAGMGRELYQTQPTFRRALDRCASLFDPLLDRPLLSVMFPRDGEESPIHDTTFTQPALFALEWSLHELWSSWGIVPDALIGHSIGEVTAACAAGVLSLPDAAVLVTERALRMGKLPAGGGMLSVSATAERLEILLQREAPLDVEIAAYNGPEQIVLSGGRDALARLVARLRAEGIEATELRVSHAFHSARMIPMVEGFERAIDGLSFRKPLRLLISNLTGQRAGDEVASAAYWARHVREPVRFAQGIQTLAAIGVDAMLEIGPHPVLVTMARGGLDDHASVRLWLPSLHREQRDLSVMLRSLASLYTHGAAVDWEAFDGPCARSLVSLPTYPFQRARYYRAPAGGATGAGAAPAPFGHLSKLDPPALTELLRGVDGLSADELALAPRMLRAFGLALDKLRHDAEPKVPTSALVWRRHPRQGAAPPRAAEGHWLVLEDRRGFGEAAAEALEARGGCCYRVREAGAFSQAGPRTWTVRHGSGEDIGRVWAAVIEQAGVLRGIVSLTCSDVPDPSSPADVGAWLRAVGSLLAWTRLALVEPAPPKLWWVTSGAASVQLGEAPRSAGQAALWGLGRSLSAEHPGAWGGLVDLPADPGPVDASELVSALADPDGEDLVAVRADGRHVQRLTRHDLEATPAWKPRPGGTWLITGGLGALGGHVARWLARQGVARLVLTSRRGEASDGASEAAASLRALGVEVELPAVDVADLQGMTQVIQAIDASGPPLTGVVHAAGVGLWSPLDALSSAELEAVTSAKIAGTLALDALTQDRDLDAFLCFSSAASVWPSPTQGAYAAANAYLDAFARRASARRRRVVALGWGPWVGGGMASEDRIAALAKQGVRALSPETALAAMACTVSSGLPHIVVADVDWPRLQALIEARGRRPILDELASGPAASSDAEPAPDGSAGSHRGALRRELDASDEPRVLLTSWLRATVAEVLGFESAEHVPPRAGFYALGMDSMMTVNLRNRIGTALDLRLPTSVAFNHPNIEAMTSYLLDQLTPQVERGAARGTSAALPRRTEIGVSLHDLAESAPVDGDMSEEALSALLDEKLGELSEYLE